MHWAVKPRLLDPKIPDALLELPGLCSSSSSSSVPQQHGTVSPEVAAHEELEELLATTRLNGFYFPASKLPPLAPDPRPPFGSRPPRMYPEPGEPRGHRIMQRWQSMPTLGQQVEQEHLRSIEQTTRAAGGPPDPPQEQKGAEQAIRLGREQRRPRVSVDHTVSCPADGRRDFPFIPCICCKSDGKSSSRAFHTFNTDSILSPEKERLHTPPRPSKRLGRPNAPKQAAGATAAAPTLGTAPAEVLPDAAST